MSVEFPNAGRPGVVVVDTGSSPGASRALAEALEAAGHAVERVAPVLVADGKPAPREPDFAEHIRPPAAVESLGVFVDSFFDATGLGSVFGADVVDYETPEYDVAAARLSGGDSLRLLIHISRAERETLRDGIERFVMLRHVDRGGKAVPILEIVRGRVAMEKRVHKSRALSRPLAVRVAPRSST